MSNICKIGAFSDGHERIRVVANGYDADPAPSDVRNIIYDSDWPEVVNTRTGYYGTLSATYSSTSGGAATTVSFSTLPYVPIGIVAEPVRKSPGPLIGGNYNASSSFFTTMASASLVSRYAFANNGVTYTGVPPYGGLTAGYPDETYTVGWWALLLDTTLLGNYSPPSRTGTSFIKLSADGPVVSKPGASVISTNPDDYLIAPLSMGAMLGQPAAAGTINSLPSFSTFTYYDPVGRTTTTHYEYMQTFAHGLGYMPIAFLTTSDDFRVPTAYQTAQMFVDATNVYIYTSSLTNSASISIQPTSYFIYRRQWF